MPSKKFEKHIDIYKNRYEFFQDGKKQVFYEGFQNESTQQRYARINQALQAGYLENMMNSISEVDFSGLSEENLILLRNIVNGITSNEGRALVGLAFLQLTIKSIAPDQSIRLHKGATRKGSFSWVDGISMRTIDSKFITPFLREQRLLYLNKYGLFMTRSLAENYPYTSLYKAEVSGPFSDWIAIVDAIEEKRMSADLGLRYLMALLKNRSECFQSLAESTCQLLEKHRDKSFVQIKKMIKSFFDTTGYSARAFEVAIHSFFQAMDELNLLSGVDIVPLSQMRSANKKHGNVGDVELAEDGVIIESWDAKYGKPYLRDELDELRDKLITHPEVRVAGFVVDSAVDLRPDIVRRKEELMSETATDIYLFSFDEWVKHEIKSLSSSQKNDLAQKWLTAIVESFAQKRLQIAPIDEPCDEWMQDLNSILSK